MKKTLLSVLVGFAVIGSAIAAPSPEDRKALCEKHPEKYVWVEKDQFCAPINPCKSDKEEVKKAYCITVFEDLQLPWYTAGELLAEAYMKNVLHTKGKPFDKRGRSMHPGDITSNWDNAFKQDYMAYNLDNGGYAVFEFDDLIDESVSGTTSHALGLPLDGTSLQKFRADNAIKGAFTAFGYIDGRDVQDEALCKRIASLATDVFMITYDGVFRYEVRDGMCEIYLVTTSNMR